MAITEKEITLQGCLQAVGILELPKKITENYNKTWIKSIVLVKKCTGHESYCLCENDGCGKPIIKRDFGRSAAVVAIQSIHPYVELDKKYTPDLRSDKQISLFLVKNGYKEDYIESLLSKDGKSSDQVKKDRNTIKEFITKSAIKLANQDIAETQRCQEIQKYAKRIKNDEEERL